MTSKLIAFEIVTTRPFTGRHLFENRYCNGCQCTTRHENRTESALCLRCGVVKFPVKKNQLTI